ncbi:GntR family transcriptional regulator [Amycolatopsis sp. GM8]|uniref:GntR family transcriptional regulator n=1 Tax=Amycolatopsis sp. GM8 TaxID=2896530 RepID=UPI002103DF8B|nr:GntR family transcriptional regulator [Amycolatopsis sp. GM8]
MGSLVDKVHGELRKQLLGGSFSIGEALSEERLARLLGVSRTPVREALRRLANEDLVVADSAGRYRPKVPDLPRIQGFYEVRLRLEELSVERAVREASDKQLHEIEDYWLRLSKAVPGPDPSFVYEDESFHVGIARAGGNLALAELLGNINNAIRIIRVHDFVIPGRIEATIAQHLEIIAAILARKPELAVDRMREHISESASLVQDRVLRALTGMLERTSSDFPGGSNEPAIGAP